MKIYLSTVTSFVTRLSSFFLHHFEFILQNIYHFFFLVSFVLMKARNINKSLVATGFFSFFGFMAKDSEIFPVFE